MEDIERSSSKIVIINAGDKRIGFVIDEMLGQQEIVIKTLGNILKNVEHITGATILGEGKVILILDALGIFSSARKSIYGMQPSAPRAGKIKSGGDNAAPAAPDAPAGGKGGIKILVVDDSSVIRKSIASALQSSGYEVIEAVDGVDALEKLRRNDFSLVTVDIMMPRMDGYELVKNIRALPKYLKTPVIMVSSKSEKIDKLRGLDAGADEYITKPFEKSVILSVINNFINKG